jgi:hypothetical protein
MRVSQPLEWIFSSPIAMKSIRLVMNGPFGFRAVGALRCVERLSVRIAFADRDLLRPHEPMLDL